MLKDSIIYLAARAGPGLLGLATIAALTRLLSPAAYGDYALAVSLAGLLNALLFSWNSQALYRHYATAGQSGLPRLLATGLAGFLAALGLTAVAAVAAAPFVTAGRALVAAGLLLTATFAWLELTGLMLNLEARAGRYSLLQFARSLVQLAAGGAAALVTGSAAAVVAAVAAAWLLLAVLPAFGGWVGIARRGRFDPATARRLMRYGLPLALSIALGQLLASLDRLMLAGMGPHAAVGEYAVGFDLVQFAIGALASALSMSFYPAILRTLEEAGPAAARARLAIYSAIQWALLLPLAAGLAITAPGIARLLIGPDLREGAAAVMPWICAGALMAMLKAFHADFAFQMGRWTAGGAITAGAALAANVVLNLALIPRHGAPGAALASALSFAVALALALVLGRWRGFPLPPPGRDHARALFATGGMVLALWPTRGAGTAGMLATQVALGVAVYVALALATDLLGLRTMALARWRRDRPRRG